MADKYYRFLERDAIYFGRQVTTFLMNVLLNIRLVEGARSAFLRRCGKGKGKTTPLQAWAGTWGSRRSRLSVFLDNWHMKVLRFSALRTGRL